MASDIVKTIGTGGDYSTIAAWAAAIPANLVTADERWIGKLKNQTFNEAIALSSHTTDATRYIVLQCEAGASFTDQAGVRSTALRYSTANGAAIQNAGGSGAPLRSDVSFTRFIGLQVKCTGYANTLQIGSSANTCTIDSCIITSSGSAGTIARDNSSSTATRWVNCLFQYGFTLGDCIQLHGKAYNCTFVNTAGAGSSNCFDLEYNIGVVKNCAVFGFNTFTTGTPAAGSDYNATDKASAVTGTHNQTSLTFSAQFTSTTTDFRATAGSGLHNGTPDATNAPLDISQFDRDDTTPYIGAWEASAPSVSFTVSPSTIPADHSGNITLTITGTSTTFSSGSTITRTNSLSGTTAVTLGTWTRISDTSATQAVTTGAGAGTWKLTIDGTDSPTLTTVTPALSVNPTSGLVSGTTNITLTGTGTLWNADSPTFTYTSGPVGTSIGSISIVSDTSATAVMTTGSATGSGTLTDPSTGKTCTFTVNAVTGTITVTSPVQYQTYQRNGSNQASIPITGTYTGGPGTLTVEASFNGGSYSTIATAAGGTFSGTLATQTAGQGTLTVRFVNATGITGTVANVGIGDVFIVAGQSNADGHLSALQSYSHATLKATAYDRLDTAWQEGNDPFFSSSSDGSPWPLFATLHMADQGVPCALLQTAVGGKALDDDASNPFYFSKRNPLTGTAGTGYNFITTTVSGSGVNGVKAILWVQGENDIDNNDIREAYCSSLIRLAESLAADVAGTPKLIPIIRGYSVNGGTYPAIRLAIADAAKLSANILGPVSDLDIPDTVGSNLDGGNALHWTRAATGQIVANRFWAVLKAELFGGTADTGRGPRVTSCQYNAARTAITVCFDQVLKTGLTFDTSIWTVTGTGSGATVSAVAYHGTDTRAVVLTLSGAASLPILVSLGLVAATAGKVFPRGPDFTLPDASTINLPAEPFKDVQAAAAEVSGGGGGSGGGSIIGSSVIVSGTVIGVG